MMSKARAQKCCAVHMGGYQPPATTEAAILNKIFKRQKRKIINAVYGLRFQKIEKELQKIHITSSQSNSLIKQYIENNNPFFVGRMGVVEQNICWEYSNSFFLSEKTGRKWARQAQLNAGISNYDDPSLNRFSVVYLSAIPFADMLGIWPGKGVFPLLWKYGSSSLRHCEIDALSPWAAYQAKEDPWTQALYGKSILVIHPFVSSIMDQFRKRESIKSVRDILPEFELQTLTPPVTFAGQDNGKSWVSNLQNLMNEVSARNFDIAIIGCGSYGFPLGAFIKQMGKKALHLGGVTQLLFGIRGGRWDDHPYSSLMDETWIRPSKDETPTDAHKIENACYW